MSADRVLRRGGHAEAVVEGGLSLTHSHRAQQAADAEQYATRVVARDADDTAIDADTVALCRAAGLSDDDVRSRVGARPVDAGAFLDLFDKHRDSLGRGTRDNPIGQVDEQQQSTKIHRPNTKSAEPAAIATCCLPSIRKDTGLAAMLPPVWKSQTGLPVRESSAKKFPSLVPPKTRPPAVESRPAQGGDC